jgi:hypothetical protein
MRWLFRAALVSLAAFGIGCDVFVAKETLYLQSVQDQATQEDVRQRLGAPHMAVTTEEGNPIWVYQVYTQDPGTQNQWGTPGTWCDEYVLTFDRKGILRRWTHKSEGHGGELMPTYCVTGGFKLKS